MAGPLFAMAWGVVSSCAPTTPAPPVATNRSDQVTASLDHRWVKVRINPPIWYPSGTPADCGTGFRDGEWVYTEDARGTRLFVPFKGLAADRRKDLLAEALAARAPGKVKRITAEEAKHRAGTRAATAALIVLPVVEGAWAVGTWWDYWKGRYDNSGQPAQRTIPSSNNPTPWLPPTAH